MYILCICPKRKITFQIYIFKYSNFFIYLLLLIFHIILFLSLFHIWLFYYTFFSFISRRRYLSHEFFLYSSFLLYFFFRETKRAKKKRKVLQIISIIYCLRNYPCFSSLSYCVVCSLCGWLVSALALSDSLFHVDFFYILLKTLSFLRPSHTKIIFIFIFSAFFFLFSTSTEWVFVILTFFAWKYYF